MHMTRLFFDELLGFGLFPRQVTQRMHTYICSVPTPGA